MDSGIPESRYPGDMPRHPSPDGRRVHMNVKFSEAEAALVDAARGSRDRGAWLRGVALEALGIPESRPVSIGGFEVPVIVSDRQPPGTITLASAWEEDGELKVSAASAVNITADEPAPKPCKHKGLRLTKGVCPDCQQYVASK